MKTTIKTQTTIQIPTLDYVNYLAELKSDLAIINYLTGIKICESNLIKKINSIGVEFQIFK